MSALGSVAIGIASGLVASLLFLAALRIFLTPKILISEQIVHRFNRRDEEVYRIKVLNDRRWSEAVKLTFELVSLTPLSVPAVTIKGHRRFFVGWRRTIKLDSHKQERSQLPLRPTEMVSIPRKNLNDASTPYAFRVTTPDIGMVRSALQDEHQTIRFRVYAEHPWSGRGRVFEQDFSTEGAIVDGDFPVGPSLVAFADSHVASHKQRRRRPAAPPVPETEP